MKVAPLRRDRRGKVRDTSAGDSSPAGATIPPADLGARQGELAGGDPELHLRADRSARYERVAEVLAAAQKAGIVKIAFVTESAAKP